MLTEDEIKNALKAVKYPGYSRDVVSFGLVKQIATSDGAVSVSMQITAGTPEVARQIKAESEGVLKALPGVNRVHVEVAQSGAAPDCATSTCTLFTPGNALSTPSLSALICRATSGLPAVICIETLTAPSLVAICLTSPHDTTSLLYPGYLTAFSAFLISSSVSMRISHPLINPRQSTPQPQPSQAFPPEQAPQSSRENFGCAVKTLWQYNVESSDHPGRIKGGHARIWDSSKSFGFGSA